MVVSVVMVVPDGVENATLSGAVLSTLKLNWVASDSSCKLVPSKPNIEMVCVPSVSPDISIGVAFAICAE